MKIVCTWHVNNFGFEYVITEKPPFGDTTEIHTLCPACQQIFTEDVEKHAQRMRIVRDARRLAEKYRRDVGEVEIPQTSRK